MIKPNLLTKLSSNLNVDSQILFSNVGKFTYQMKDILTTFSLNILDLLNPNLFSFNFKQMILSSIPLVNIFCLELLFTFVHTFLLFSLRQWCRFILSFMNCGFIFTLCTELCLYNHLLVYTSRPFYYSMVPLYCIFDHCGIKWLIIVYSFAIKWW